VPRVGRSGWTGMVEKADMIWAQLQTRHKSLKNIENHRSKMYIVGRAKKNKETKKYELPSDVVDISDKLVNNCVI
jgi:seryl-tRNA synthetase